MPFSSEIQCIIDLVKSAADAVPQEYYRLQTIYSSNGIVRERIYCYEIYHIMRTEQERNLIDNTFSLHGEIDKSGHNEFENRDRKNPDFVFHVPGSMSNNAVVMEVKGKIIPSNIKKDFLTLYRFTSQYQYEAGVFLLFNHTYNELIQGMRGTDLSEISETEKILIICKRTHETPFEIHPFSQFIPRIT
ncbi:MAG: hypothetical protein JXN62_12060 [Bacteroidales bacterium]|nr:hypothetical protein [Bacteroidales bacterium]